MMKHKIRQFICAGDPQKTLMNPTFGDFHEYE